MNDGHGIADYIKFGLGVKEATVATNVNKGNQTWTTTGCASFSTPGPLTTGRYLCPSPPCEIFCLPDDTDCLSSGSAAAATCSPQWSAYNSASMSFQGQITNTNQWENQTLSLTYTRTSTEYSATSTANSVYSSAGQLPVTPVYLLGSAQTTLTATTTTYQTITAPPTYSASPPCCQVTQVIMQDCLQCSINGGTVQLLYWPSNTHNSSVETTAGPNVITTLGTTLTSPTVYISFQTVFAENLCTAVGGNHTGSIIGLAPQDVSTIYGNLLAKSWSYRQIDYQYLATSQVPISVYEEQPFCGGHCTTILPEYNPTLSMPPQIRSLDPAWGGCDLALYGIYDPPLALTPVASIVMPTAPSNDVQATSASPSQAATPSQSTAAATALADNVGSIQTTRSTEQTQSVYIKSSLVDSTTASIHASASSSLAQSPASTSAASQTRAVTQSIINSQSAVSRTSFGSDSSSGTSQMTTQGAQASNGSAAINSGSLGTFLILCILRLACSML